MNNFNTIQNFPGVFAHQSVIGADIRLAFHAVDQQQFNLTGGVEFDVSRKHGTAQSGYPGLANAAEDLLAAQCCDVLQIKIYGLILAIGFQHTGQYRQGRRVVAGSLLYGANDA